MRRRWPVLAAAVVVAATPVLASCGDDDDGPANPTVTLFQETIAPQVSTDVTT